MLQNIAAVVPTCEKASGDGYCQRGDEQSQLEPGLHARTATLSRLNAEYQLSGCEIS